MIVSSTGRGASSRIGAARASPPSGSGGCAETTAAIAWGGASGLIAGLALPPFHAWSLAWVALVPLFYAVERYGTGAAVAAAAAAGLVLSNLALYGLIAYEPLLWLAVLAVLPLWPVLAVALLRAVGVGGWNVRAVLAAPVSWVASERLLQELLLPAGIGITQARSGAPLQVAEIGGASGLSFLLVLTGVLGARALHRTRHCGLRRGAIAAVWAAVVPLMAFAYGTLRTPSASDADCAARARVLQPAIRYAVNVQSWAEPSERRRIRGWFWEQIETAAASEADLIFWPEGGAAFESFRVGAARERLLAHARSEGQHLFVSAIDFDSRGRKFNSIFSFSSKGELSKYDKRSPVPVAEASITSGRRSGRVDTAAGPAGLMVCYESCFPGRARALAERGAAFLVASANDTALGLSAVPGLHLSMAILRAVENRRPVVHASNGGPSAIIGPSGEILAKTRMRERTAIEGCIPTVSGRSLFMRFGYGLAPVCALASALLLTESVLRRRRRRRQEDPRPRRRPVSVALEVTGAMLALALCGVVSLPLAAVSAWAVARNAEPPGSAREAIESLLPRSDERARAATPVVLSAAPGPTPLEVLASYYGVHAPNAGDEALAAGGGVTSLSKLARAAEQLGFTAQEARGDLAALQKARLPVLVDLQQLGLGVLLELDSESAAVFTRATGLQSLPIRLFQELLGGESLRIRPPALEGVSAKLRAELPARHTGP